MDGWKTRSATKLVRSVSVHARVCVCVCIEGAEIKLYFHTPSPCIIQRSEATGHSGRGGSGLPASEPSGRTSARAGVLHHNPISVTHR